MYCCVSCACFHLCLWLAKCCDSFDCCILLRQHDKDPPPHKPGSPWGKPARYLQLRSFTCFCTTWSLLSTILNPASWWLSQSCDSYAAAFCCTDVSPNCTGNSGILVSGKIRMAPKTSKTTTAGWLATNSKTMPLFMKSQINNLKSKASPTQSWIALGKLVATYNFAASHVLHYMISTQDHFRPF